MMGRWPGFRSTRINPSCSSRTNPSLAASRPTCRNFSAICVSLNGFPFAIPCRHQSANATLSTLPGNLAALLSQFMGIGPRRNSTFMGATTNVPDAGLSCNRFTGILGSWVGLVVIYTYKENVRVRQLAAGGASARRRSLVYCGPPIKFITLFHITNPRLSM